MNQESFILRIQAILETSDSVELAGVPPHLIPAGVLIAIVRHPTELSILFTQRSKLLRRHAGEICFPGGKVDRDDRSVVETALREAREEVGLPSDRVRVLGISTPYISASGFFVVPVVGIVKPSFTPRISRAEVEEVFEVNLENFLDTDRFSYKMKTDRKKIRKSYQIQVKDRLIHGITAGILYQLSQRLSYSP